MKLKFEDIEIPVNAPFQNCQLGRKKYADILENLIKYGKDGYVMSLDGAWGTGKTTFIKLRMAWDRRLSDQQRVSQRK